MKPWKVEQSKTDPEMYEVRGAYLVADKLPIEDAELIAAAPANVEHVEKLKLDIEHLLAIIDYMAECTGEGPEGEDAVLVEQIRRWPGTDMPVFAGVSPTPEQVRRGARASVFAKNR